MLTQLTDALDAGLSIYSAHELLLLRCIAALALVNYLIRPFASRI